MAGRIKMPLGSEGRPRPRRLWLGGDPAPLPKRGRSPQFSAHVYCSQTAGWMKTPLGAEVDLVPGHIVLDGDPAPLLKKGAEPPQFSAHFYRASYASAVLGVVILSVRPSVRLSVRHTRAL